MQPIRAPSMLLSIFHHICILHTYSFKKLILIICLNNIYRRICIAGHSAGAHLAATLLHDDDWINRMTQEGYFALLKEIILIGGIYNIKPLVDTSFGIALQLTE